MDVTPKPIVQSHPAGQLPLCKKENPQANRVGPAYNIQGVFVLLLSQAVPNVYSANYEPDYLRRDP